RDRLADIVLGGSEVPRTPIVLKTERGAAALMEIVCVEFSASQHCWKEITYCAAEDSKSDLAQLGNDDYPRLAVTVERVATWTDVKPLECLLFMRDVKSRNYFEQMKGRGTRTLDHDSLKKVTPSAVTAKTHYVIVDAVGVTKSLKTASQPLITKPSVPLKD